MITLTFLVCYTLTGRCVGVGPQLTFMSINQCETFAEALMDDNQAKASQGVMAPHAAVHKCVDWGKEL
jgi:hypothetical protein